MAAIWIAPVATLRVVRDVEPTAAAVLPAPAFFRICNRKPRALGMLRPVWVALLCATLRRSCQFAKAK